MFVSVGITVSLTTILAAPVLTWVWANHLEPNLLRVTRLNWNLPKKFAHLHGLRIIQISDLHLNHSTPDAFLKKVSRRISSLSPDILVFTGDFVCRAKVETPERLKHFLCSLHAPLGCFACLGNHDYATYVSRDIHGKINTISAMNSRPLKRAFTSVYQSLFASSRNEFADTLNPQIPNPHLVSILRNTPFQLLHNQSATLSDTINIVGLGDFFAKQFDPKKAFTDYNPTLPGIILSHNPDTIHHLQDYPGDVVFSGHSHGPQISLPWPKFANTITNKLSGLENPELARGLFSFPEESRLLYVNRGLGGWKRIRFCSPPEICLMRCLYEP
ncbi:UDP-2,3-diacylglucosamine diphosphatase LpxG [Chlamydia trachomatis]|uniref:UDP-2,3-diacylglucosamine diphosphatase LpxG n=1 Tax=Chlamydia trachomatis TaxID=813 RepID=UPI0001B59BDA|nr:UDP-2,3-diacylglucosamine diphosphatase LpxG [Chlamydia trachomatis]AGT64437.1 metallophosphoesterase [Chlamydia trachomatis]AGT65367.1 metallophosphoesterase [Chlamydia trachomatis]AGT66293.1 metallophosphoesterase [Chlamydia trachomatis]AGT67221.1 metallophosphoesterase [Chlamydia trachomatis F/11-96]AGT69074.1 metallophosphoesterase [Chlamydia trachomatis]